VAYLRGVGEIVGIRGCRRVNVLPVLIGAVEELENVVHGRITDCCHVLGERDSEPEKATLRVVPRVGAKLAMVRLHALHDAANAKVVVVLIAFEISVK
jgi:hypothetical protein